MVVPAVERLPDNTCERGISLKGCVFTGVQAGPDSMAGALTAENSPYPDKNFTDTISY
jgi:hypothetical protein